ncbi:hypothetical protein KFK09_026871 [Dendrobium nobile]|uniref:Reverse transcriptase zinc-binding domain-containing protein n=1 Tax=Dendrobium nobile TaxID=94219 RepID=A0A8T3A833_DENNO|nr:hypothetical protein KFK09_026871 [Dendrobium nobile]
MEVQPILNSFPVNESIAVIIDGINWALPASLPEAIHCAFSEISVSPGTHVNLYWGNGKKCKHRHYREFYFKDFAKVNWWKFVWHKWYVIRYSSFCWMAIIGGLKSADSLIAKGINVNAICALCHCSTKTVSHLFFECDYSFSILSKLMSNLGFLLLRPNILQIFEYIDDTHTRNKDFYYLLICCAVYHIWRERNDRKFGDKSVSSTSLVLKIKAAIFSKIMKWKTRGIMMDLL